MKKKRGIIIAITVIVLAIGGGSIYAASRGMFMSAEEKSKVISDCIADKDYSKAIELTDRYFADDADYDTIIENINLCKQYNVGNIYTAKQQKAKAQEQRAYTQFCNNVAITNMESQQRNYGNYFDGCITVENRNSTPISYIEFNINMYDTNGNLVNTAMTNATNIAGNSKRIVTKMLPCGEGNWDAQITKITRG